MDRFIYHNNELRKPDINYHASFARPLVIIIVSTYDIIQPPQKKLLFYEDQKKKKTRGTLLERLLIDK